MTAEQLKAKFPNASPAFILKNLGAGGGVDNGHLGATGTPEAIREVIAPAGSARPARTIPNPQSGYNALLVRCYWRDVGIPDPQTEYRFDAKRRWRFDFAWPTLKVALEVQGGIWTQGRHTRGLGYMRDMEKHNEALIAGWRPLYCTPDQLCTAETVNLIKRAMLTS